MREFYKIRGNLYNVAYIKSIRFVNSQRTTRQDGVVRQWVVTVDPACTGTDPRYSNIWCTKDELGPLLEDAEREATMVHYDQNELESDMVASWNNIKLGT
jgi:hypothetical protein